MPRGPSSAAAGTGSLIHIAQAGPLPALIFRVFGSAASVERVAG